MIQVTLSSLLLLGMAVGVALLGGLWMVAVWLERRAESQARQDLVACRICGHVYENTDRRNVTACPRCGSLNEPTKPKPI